MLIASCRGVPEAEKAAPAHAAGASASAAPAAPATALPPLDHVSWLEQLPLADGHRAVIAPPVGAREPRPLIVAVHGAGDRPDWSCGGWRLAASEYAFVVCPEGLKFDAQRFAWDSPNTIRDRVDAAIAAARARFGPYIADGPVVFAGFSQGATLARAALLEKSGRFPAVALAEGGYDLLRDAGFLRQLHDAGTARVMIVCGSDACMRTANRVKSRLTRARIDPVVSGDPLSGHNLNQRMQDALQASWPAFVADLPNWKGFEPYLAERRRNPTKP